MPDRGVVVTEVGRRRLAHNSLKSGDVILAIDGFEVDSEGNASIPTTEDSLSLVSPLVHTPPRILST